nr:tetratricopeptide repeat protein [Saprospiraceae bacterium]
MFLFFCTLANVCIPSLSAQSEDTERQKIDELLEESHEYRVEGNYDQSLRVLEKATALAGQLKKPKMLAQVLNQKGVLHIYNNKYPEALANLQKSLTIYREIDDQDGIAECLNNIASIHFTLKNYNQAKEHWLNSLWIRETKGSLKQLGISYNNMGLIMARLNDLDSALIYHHKSLNLWEQMNDMAGIGLTLNHIGGIIKDKGDLEGALNIMEESYQKLKFVEDSHGQAKMHVEAEIGLLLSELGEYERAIEWCRESCLNSHRSIYKRASQNCCHTLYLSHLGLKKHQKALEYYQKYIGLRDTFLGTQTIQEVTKLELNYAFDQIHRADSLRYQANQELQQQRIYNQRIGLISIGGILFLVTLLGIVIYKGKQRSEELLLNILPIETAKELKETGRATARHYDSVSVMFADVKGFTQISEELTPEQLVSELNTYFSAFDQIMEKYGIEKIKTIGDCYMAAGGLPVPNVSHAVQVVKAALEMQEFMFQFNETKRSAEGPRFEIRIGIHSGPVVAGIVGTKKFQYDIWGDTVNTASRLEASSEPNRVNISGQTYKLVKDQFICSRRGKVIVKGKGEIDMFFVEKNKPAANGV